ncbi:MAG TPA: MATE family efflux transporter [Gemmatimonadaceae bacterium]|jgi:putative MATE family efflux protein
MPQTHQRLLEGPIIKSLLALAIPIALANILQAAYQLIDAYWVGRLGGSAVAAVSVSTPIMFLTIGLGAGLALAGSTLIAQYFGARNQEMVDHVAAQTLLMIVLVSVILGGLGFAFAPQLLHLMGVAPDVYAGALGFMRVSFAGLVFNFFFFMFQSIMRGIGEAKLPVFIVLGTVILNFVLDPPFIFGWGPIPAQGVQGAALATVATQSLAALVGLGVLLSGRYAIHLVWRDFIPDFSYIKRAFVLGFPASIEQSARALGITVLTFLITSFGTLTLAAYGVGSTILQVVMIPAMGLSMAVSALVGQNIGAGNMKRAEEIGRLGAWMGFGNSDRTWRDRVCVRVAARGVFRSRGSGRYLARRDLRAHHGARVGLSRRAVLVDRRAARVGQHGVDDGVDLDLTMGASIPTRVRVVEAHRPG